MKNKTVVKTTSIAPSKRTGGIKRPVVNPVVKPVVEPVGTVAEFLQTNGNRESGVDAVRNFATSVAEKFANATKTVDQPVDQPVVPAKVWTVSELLDNPELQPDLFPRSNPKAFMNAVRRIMGADGMLPPDEAPTEGAQSPEELKLRFVAAHQQLVADLLSEYDSWYSVTGKLLPTSLRGKLITADTTLSLPWVGSWVVGGSVMDRVENSSTIRMTGFVPAPSMLAWTETLRGLTPEQVEAIKATKAAVTDLGAVAEAIASVITAGQDHFVPTRFGVVEVSSLERVVTVALKGGGHGVQIVRQARVKDGVINAGSHLNLTPMSRIMSFYELKFVDDVIAVESVSLDTVL